MIEPVNSRRTSRCSAGSSGARSIVTIGRPGSGQPCDQSVADFAACTGDQGDGRAHAGNIVVPGSGQCSASASLASALLPSVRQQPFDFLAHACQVLERALGCRTVASRSCGRECYRARPRRPGRASSWRMLHRSPTVCACA